jgi:N,N-dimethylformamidase
LFNGKVDRCGIHSGLLSDDDLDALISSGSPPADGRIAHWDTTAGYTDEGIDDVIRDMGPHGLDAIGVNKPVRAMTGYNWDGRSDTFRLGAEQYGGVAFHEDAITDCRWEPSVELQLPDDLKSGVYALRITSGGVEEYLPFFVRPHRATAKIVVQMATATYLAYANEHLAFDAQVAQSIAGHTPTLAPSDIELYKNKQFGLSTYDHHADGLSGVCYSGWRRPIAGIRPKFRNALLGSVWALPADLSIIGWLEAQGFEYDVITDHDVHREGADLLSQWNFVILASHPEYYSEEMLAATEEFVGHGGRLSYTGANGLYWVTSFVGEGDVIEVRKLEGGTRAWQAAPGEHYHASTGQRGGIWRHRGRGPHKVTGVGFAAEGFDKSSFYRRMPDSYRPEVAWMFDGVGSDTGVEGVFGAQGLALGGAAGLELDRYDLAAGTPPQTLLLASSEGHSSAYPTVQEEVLTNLPGRAGGADPKVRADVTYLPTANGGAVFCTGSIGWASALPFNNYDNDTSRLFRNVTVRLSADEPLPPSGRTPAQVAKTEDQEELYVARWRVQQCREIVELVDDSVVAEHAKQPFGPMSDVLARFQAYHRTWPRPDALQILEEVPGSKYRIADGDVPGAESYEQVEEALHAVFLERLQRMRKVAHG